MGGQVFQGPALPFLVFVRGDVGENVVVQSLAAPLGFDGPHHEITHVRVGEAGHQRLGTAGVNPVWQQGVQNGAGGRVRVLIEGDIMTATAGVVHEGCHLRAEAGHRAVIMGDVHGRTGSPTDFQRLPERVEEAVAQGVAGMGAVETAFFRGDGGDGGQFGGVAVSARGVGQSGGEPERAVAHALTGKFAHCGQFRIGGQAGRPAHGGHPNGGVRDEMEDVAGGVTIEQGEEVGDAAPADIRWRPIDRRQIDQELLQGSGRGGSVRQAVHAEGLGGDSLPDLGLVVRIGEQLEVGMGVHINEAGANHVAAGVHGAPSIDRRGIAGDDLYGVSGYGDAGAITRRAGAVDHRAVSK